MPRLDRNARARLMVHAEALDRRTRLPGQHGGVLKRTGLAVLKALLFGFASVATGRCDPSFETLARASGCARSTVAAALRRLEAAGLLERVRRQVGRVRYSNAYRFKTAEIPTSGSRAKTTTMKNLNFETRAREAVAPASTPADTKPIGERAPVLLATLAAREQRLGIVPAAARCTETR